MRPILLAAAAALLATPVLAQGVDPKASGDLAALDKACRDGSVQACTELSVKSGPSGPGAPGSGRAGAREREEAHGHPPADSAAGGNAVPRASGEGGAMPVPSQNRR
ncbi:hypothetical protein [Paracraurococcus lichenis]|uniref:Uncharacterized protein n=1 Tax=Paracraurococcus lichenis TaxID=3064888 RepID=A0ABT9DZH4_9PROT|nr:hypothetical protein [Paracraurococcus sp. LOR1-02]MDO9709278.1 hypothetical protein [Paracraurococcus sp. LOR1-02]